ncbi:MAG: hypothetical protein QOH06_245 [Acidobacteriota bacterium]|jgi:hypothetical protein|nr:hypothetical protein [Acidobacteriota bacterium]
MFRRALFALLSLPVLALPLAAGADTLYTMKSHTDAIKMGSQSQPAKDGTVKVWTAGDRLRRDDGDQTMIFRLDKNRLYLLDHEDKTYSEVALPIDLRKMMPKGSEAMADQIAAGMKVSVQVAPSDETKKVGQWNARRYDVTVQSAMGMKITTTMWVSKEIEGFAGFNKMAGTMASLQPGSGEWVKQLEKIDGFPVLTESQVDALGAKFSTREELVSVETKAPPAGHYDPPAGYKAQAYNPIAGMSQ